MKQVVLKDPGVAEMLHGRLRCFTDGGVIWSVRPFTAASRWVLDWI
jgi:hypothetical protein